MPVTNYYTIDGQMIGYKDAGGRKDFLTDVLGSVTGEVDQTGTNRTFNGRYKPYGGSLWASGSRGTFGWVGTWGYKSTGLKNSSHYVRARHYSQTSGIWTTQDSLWPNELAYGYVSGRVLTNIDPTGKGQRCCKRTKKMVIEPPEFEFGVSTMVCREVPDFLPGCKGLSKCSSSWKVFGLPVTAEAVCKVFGSMAGDYNCCEVAQKYGVSGKCLCSILLTESIFYLADPVSGFQNFSGIGDTFGCAQLSVGTVKNVLNAAKTCMPDLLKGLKPSNPTDEQIGDLLRRDCSWSLHIMALHLAVNTNPKCTGGKPGSCKNFSKLWNHHPKFQDLLKCINENIGTPCT